MAMRYTKTPTLSPHLSLPTSLPLKPSSSSLLHELLENLYDLCGHVIYKEFHNHRQHGKGLQCQSKYFLGGMGVEMGRGMEREREKKKKD